MALLRRASKYDRKTIGGKYQIARKTICVLVKTQTVKLLMENEENRDPKTNLSTRGQKAAAIQFKLVSHRRTVRVEGDTQEYGSYCVNALCTPSIAVRHSTEPKICFLQQKIGHSIIFSVTLIRL